MSDDKEENDPNSILWGAIIFSGLSLLGMSQLMVHDGCIGIAHISVIKLCGQSAQLGVFLFFLVAIYWIIKYAKIKK